MLVIVLVIVATAASIAFIPGLRRLSHRPRTGERELEAVSLGDAGEGRVRPGSHDHHFRLRRFGERRVLSRLAAHRRIPDRSEQGVLYDPSEVERVVREQLYGPRNRRS